VGSFQAKFGKGNYATRQYVDDAVRRPRWEKNLLATFEGPTGYVRANKLVPEKLPRDDFAGVDYSLFPTRDSSVAEIVVETNNVATAGGDITIAVFEDDVEVLLTTARVALSAAKGAKVASLPLGRNVLPLRAGHRYDVRYSTPAGYVEAGVILVVRLYAWDLVTTLARGVVACGDSITAGYGVDARFVYEDPYHPTAAGESWPAVASAITGAPFVNLGSSGQLASAWIAQSGAAVQAAFRAGEYDILTLAHGTNDIVNGGVTAAQCWAFILANLKFAQDLGYRVSLVTILARTASQSVIDATNALIRASGYNVIDAAEITELADPTNHTYFQNDNTHPAAAGDALIGARAAQDLASAYG
jgi:lysophospholipase L1-like esterase